MGTKKSAINIFDICDTKHTTSEDFSSFYNRFKTTISMNLKKKGDKINDSEILMEDEIISPTFQDVIILWCLEKVEPTLPSLIKEKFSDVLKEQHLLKNINNLIFQEVSNLYNSSTKEAHKYLNKTLKKENDNLSVFTISSKVGYYVFIIYFLKHSKTIFLLKRGGGGRMLSILEPKPKLRFTRSILKIRRSNFVS